MDKSVLTFLKHAFKNSNTLKTKMSHATFFIAVCFVFGYLGIMIGIVPMWNYERDYSDVHVIVNAPDSFNDFLWDYYRTKYPERTDTEHESNINRRYIYKTFDSPYDFVTFSKMMREENAGTLIYFPADFSYDKTNEVLTYYRTNSLKYGIHKEADEEFLNSYYNDFLVKTEGRTNLETSPVLITTSVQYTQKTSDFAYAVAMIIPLLIFIFSLYASMSGGTNIIAGEKERGTFAAIIMSPVKRSSIILGNFLGVFLMSLIPAVLITYPGLIILWASKPSIYISATLLLLSFIAFITALSILVSTLNHTIVSAQTAYLPIFLVLLITAVTCIQKIGNSDPFYNYLPVYGHFYGIGNALTSGIVPEGLSTTTPLLDAVICSSVTFLITGIILYVCIRLLYNEKYITVSEGITLKDINKSQKSKKKIHLAFLIDQIIYPLATLSVFQTLALIPAAVIVMRDSNYSEFISGLRNVTSVSDILRISGDILTFFLSNTAFLISMTVGYILLITCYLIRIRIKEQNRKPWETLGVYKEHAAIKYLSGLLIGFLMLSAICLFLVVTKNLRFTGIALKSSDVPLLLVSIPMWIVQGAAEEVMFRGFMIPRIKEKIGITFAVIFSSLLFAVFHGANIGFTPLAGINLFLIAVLFALIYIKTDSLLITCGIHSAWNFCQGTLYGLQVSGSTSNLTIFASHYEDRATSLFTGGDFGPEGGIGVTILAVIGIAVLIIMMDRKKNSHQEA